MVAWRLSGGPEAGHLTLVPSPPYPSYPKRFHSVTDTELVGPLCTQELLRVCSVSILSRLTESLVGLTARYLDRRESLR